MFEKDEWKEIKEGIRKIRNVCENIKPLERGVQCMAKINEFEIDMVKLFKNKEVN